MWYIPLSKDIAVAYEDIAGLIEFVIFRLSLNQ